MTVERDAGAVKQQAVVAAHLVHHHNRPCVAARDGGQHGLARGALAAPEGRSGDIQDQVRDTLRGGPHQLFHRIHVIPPRLPETLVVPRVFADRNRDALARDLADRLRGCRREIALLVEHVIERQQALVLNEGYAAFFKQRGRVVHMFAGRAWSGRRIAAQYRDPGIVCPRGQLQQNRLGALNERRFLQQIGRGIATERKLGKHH